jgi:phospholipid/cholesterol/gamma-HCH transport system ATP-binding protein
VQAGEIIFSGTPSEFDQSQDPRVEHFIKGIAPVNEDVETLLRA